MIINDLQEFSNLIKPPSVILSIDYGQRKIGMAISDYNHILAMPIGQFINNKSLNIEIKNIIEKYKARAVIIGLPIDLNGIETDKTLEVRKFAGHINNFLDLPVYLQDERFTSRAANIKLMEIGYNRKERHRIDDQIAASIILENLFSKIKNLNN